MSKTQKHKSRIRKRKSRRELGSRSYKNYTEDMLKLACESVHSGQISSCDAQRQFGIPRRTIINKINKKHSKSVGHPTVLSATEETQIVRVLQTSSDFGSPLTKLDLKLLVHEYIKKNSRDHMFKNKVPGDAWVQGFLERHADKLTVRITQNISKARAEKSSQEIAEYFENLNTTLKDIPAENIINFDETNLTDDPGSSKCIFRRGVKYPERIANSTKGNISLMFTATASGTLLPLYVVYKSTHLYSEWVRGGPPETRYNCTKSGWFDSAMFENYFETIILSWAQRISGTKVVICDNLSSHLSVKVVELCEQNNIKFVFIPPRSTHLTQPLDVAFFGPLKKAWRKILFKYKLCNPNQTNLNKKHFPKLLSELVDAIQMREAKNIKSGFRASGVFPFNPQEVLKKIPEMTEEILSYGIDQALVDYLKETPKTIQVKRNKKINCEPGTSVTISDLNTDCSKSTLKKKSTDTKYQRKTKKSVFLDEATGFFKDINEDQLKYKELEEVFAISPYQDITRNNVDENQGFGKDLEEDFAISQHQDITSPQSLSKLCVAMINSCFDQTIHCEKTSLKLANFSSLKTPKGTVKKYFNKNKITILSDVIIKEGTSNVCVLKDVTNEIENKPFIALSENDLPEYLQYSGKSLSHKNENFTNVDEENSTTGTKITRKVSNIFKGTSRKSRRRYSVKKRKNTSDSDSSSMLDEDTVITLDTDESELEAENDYLISEYLREQYEKENLESPNTSFGLHEIEYFIDNQENLKKDDWVIAQFATKKTLKHYVGNVIAINDKIPTIKFVRKIKDSKCEIGTCFRYPVVDDICSMQHLEDVIKILPKPTITRRGRIFFSASFSNYNIQ